MTFSNQTLLFNGGEKLTLGPISDYEYARLVWVCIEKGLAAELTLKDGSKCPDHKMRMRTADFMVQLMKDCDEMRKGMANAKVDK